MFNRKEYMKRRYQSGKGKECNKRYSRTEKGRFNAAKAKANERNLGFVFSIDLNTEMPDEPIAYHHANDNLVYPIPIDLHNKYNEHLTLEQHRFMIYQIVRQLYKNA